jgi:uncharacterized protein (DUF488 family)
LATLYTIGHSTRPLEEFIAALQAHSVQTLVDIRSFPMSRRLPHFNREALEKSLAHFGGSLPTVMMFSILTLRDPPSRTSSWQKRI